MGAEALATCSLAAATTFASAFFLCSPKAAASGARTRPRAGEGVLVRLRTLAPLRWVAEREELKARRARCLREMPTLLDVLTLGLSSGLSFDASLELYCERYDDDLAAALAEAQLSWRLGAESRQDALSRVASELGVASLESFAATVSQALEFGSPLAAALERQSQALRDEQRSQVEEAIERVPVKMLVPLGTLVVPAMLLAILGPLVGSSSLFG